MAIEVEGIHTGEYLVSEVNTNLSRDTDILITGQNLIVGTLLGRITASKKLTRHAHGAADGSENVVGILYDNVDATAADTKVVYTKRLTVVRESSLTYSNGATAGDITAANAELDALNIALA